MSLINLTPAQLRKAADLKEQIAKLESELAGITGSQSPVKAAKPSPANKKGGMSAEGLARIIAAQKARWARIKAAKSTPSKPAVQKIVVVAVPKPAAKPAAKPAKKKGGLSAEGLARIKAAQKLRWDKIRAAKGKKK